MRHLRNSSEDAMSRLLIPGRPWLFSRLVTPRPLAALEVHRIEGSPTLESEAMDDQAIQPSRGASMVAADLGHHVGRLDAVAGSEFVDDRIRLRE
jgi:hypothetical protein